jgi:GNAT superfamily N-acetyltransferase
MSSGVTIREAGPGDVGAIHSMILELAAYERLADEVRGTEEDLRRSLFEEGAAEALIAEVDGAPAGYAIVCGTFSTFECRPGTWVEDVFVRPQCRGLGIGQAFFEQVAAQALERGRTRLEWAVLEWNDLGLGFYEKLGAAPLDDWRMMRLDGEGLRRVGSGAG